MGKFMVVSSDIIENDKVNGYTNKPTIRHKKIFDLFKKEGFNFHVPKKLIEEDDLKKLNIHDSNYLEFLKHSHGSFLKNYDKDFDRNEDLGLIPYYFSNLKYVTQLPVWKQVCCYATDVSTPIYENTFDLSLLSATNGYIAASLIEYNDVIYCLNVYPGHHASFKQFGGYCYLNNAAICARRYQELNENSKVVILDIDYHAGNGTQDIFFKDNSVFTISIHADPCYDYPNECFENEIGEEEGCGFNKNFIFPKKVQINDYLKILDDACSLIEKFNPNLIIVCFGGDTFKYDEDPSKLYRASLEIDDYEKIGKKIKELKKKIIVTQEGGYNMEHIDSILFSFIKGLI